jgi:ribonuclease BN (tRNA processing enzyme)
VIKAGQTMLAAMTSNAPHLFKMVGARLRWESLLPRRRMPLGPGLHLTPFTVDHEPPGDTCLGCRVDLDYDGTAWRIVYSGDTRPTPELDRYAQGADVLIHEAGGVDANANQVHATGHSTAGEAARLATKAGVKRLFLTPLPHEQVLSEVLEEARCHYSGPVSVPYDLDALDFSDLLGVLPDTP